MEWIKYFIKTVKENYANFNGRTSRKEFFVYVIIYSVILFAWFILVAIAGAISSILALIIYIPLFLFILGLIVPTYAIVARRLHDVGRSGWYMFVPIASLIWVASVGDGGDNQYGAAPEAFEMPSVK